MGLLFRNTNCFFRNNISFKRDKINVHHVSLGPPVIFPFDV